MIDIKQYEIYKSSGQYKKLSEIFLGVHEISWIIAKAKYQATCTEAINLNSLEKAICGILNIDNGIGITSVGSILGFNVIEDIKNKEYIDIAEKELVYETFKTLDQFEMIESDDSEYSSCDLTSIGKEYYSVNKKFRTTANKDFTLYFDITGNNHKEARKIFESVAKKEEIEEYESEIKFEDESLIKSFAASQIPDVYDPDLMNSFKDLRLNDVIYYYFIIDLVYIFDSENQCPKIRVYDSFDFQEINCLTNYFASNNSLVLDYFNKFKVKESTDEEIQIISDKYFNDLVKTQKQFQQFDDTTETLFFKTEFFDQFRIVPLYTFFINLDNFVAKLTGEIWMMFNSVTESLIELLITIIESSHSENKYLFIYLPNEVIEYDIFNHLMQSSQKSDNSYIILKDKVEEFNILAQFDEQWVILKKETRFFSYLDEEEHIYWSDFIVKKNVEFKHIVSYIKEYKNDFSNAYYQNIHEDLLDRLKNINPDDYNEIDNFKLFLDVDKKIRPFRDLKEYSNLYVSLEKEKIRKYNDILQSRKSFYINKLTRVKENFFALKELTKKTYNKIIKEINTIEKNVLENEHDLTSEINKLYEEINLIAKNITILLDSEILIIDPLILSNIKANINILLTDNIIEELNSKASNKKYTENAKFAIKEVIKSQKKKNIRWVIGNSFKVPKAYRSTNHINALLGIALQYTDNNLLLVTDNEEIINKSVDLKITTKNFPNFRSLLKRREYLKK